MFNVRLAFARVNSTDRRYSIHTAWPPSDQHPPQRGGRYLGPDLARILLPPARRAVAVGAGGGGNSAQPAHQLALLDVPGLPEVHWLLSSHRSSPACPPRAQPRSMSFV
jgi:hypothetical protein